ncbi:CxxxxCH/CxxCH domain-containing protein [bacterium]|nr:CxxxxCH/CxxCH domain-containing protein [bacterium]
MTNMTKKQIVLIIALFAALLIAGAGCESEVDPEYNEFTSVESYHNFDGTREHDDYLLSLPLVNGMYDVSECQECHGADLRGVPEGPDGGTLRSCYRCHNENRHRIGFDDVDEHSDYMVMHEWEMDDCFLCHTATTQGGAYSFGGSCSSTNCHSDGHGGPNACNTCHGDFSKDPGNLDNAAPPRDVNKNVSTDSVGVGAHQTHLNPNSALFAEIECSACHVVPDEVNSDRHIQDNIPHRSEVIFSGVASADNASPRWNHDEATCSSTHCHGDGATPVWTEVGEGWGDCGSCHTMPPSIPRHDEYAMTDCVECHSPTVDANGNIIHPEKHVNGVVDLLFP